MASLDSAAFGAAITTYEAIEELLGRLSSYAQLVHAGDMADPEVGRFYQTIQEKVTEASSETLFFTLEINRLDDAAVERLLADPSAGRYAPCPYIAGYPMESSPSRRRLLGRLCRRPTRRSRR